MNVLCEGEVVVILDGGDLVECVVISFYTYKGNELVRLRGIADDRPHIRLRSIFDRPRKAVPKLSTGGNN